MEKTLRRDTGRARKAVRRTGDVPKRSGDGVVADGVDLSSRVADHGRWLQRATLPAPLHRVAVVINAAFVTAVFMLTFHTANSWPWHRITGDNIQRIQQPNDPS